MFTVEEAMTIHTYKTLVECLVACGLSPRAKNWTFFDQEGKKRKRSMKKCLRYLKKKRCWGWYERETGEIHIWYRKGVNVYKLVELLAHEYAHSLQSTKMSKGKKELHASIAGDAGAFAFQLAVDLLDNTTKGRGRR